MTSKTEPTASARRALHRPRTLAHDDRGAVVVETILVFIILIGMMWTAWMVVRLHGANQRAYLDAHLKTFEASMAFMDLNYMAQTINDLDAPELATWKEEYFSGVEDDLTDATTYLSSEDGLTASKMSVGQGWNFFRMFDDNPFTDIDSPGDKEIIHRGYVLRPPWTFSGFPIVPSEDLILESPEVRYRMGVILDEQILDTRVNGETARDFYQLKDPWTKIPLIHQSAHGSNY